MIFEGIKKLDKGEKHPKITCGQYLIICGYYESVELNFMHTKFNYDGSFGMRMIK
jgi:hypothetical protein